jgi:predicted deacylase
MPVTRRPSPGSPPVVSPRSPDDAPASSDASATSAASAATSANAPAPNDPAAVYASINPANTRPSHELGTSFAGYTWDAATLDDVMKRFAVGDAKALIRTAIALDQGDRTLSAEELTAAARKLTSYVTTGKRWSPATLAEVMQSKGIAEETALLRAAKRHDDGDHFLDRGELEKAADVLNGVLHANDIVELQARVDRIAASPGVEATTLGHIEGHPVRSLHFPHTGSGAEPKLRVVVTAGVHGNEPCGSGAALLLMEQLLKDPRLREEVAFTVVPMVNPRGYNDGTRRTPEDEDVNRHMPLGADLDEYAEVPEEAQLLSKVFESGSHDLALDLHSGYAKRDGFWLYPRGGEDLAVSAMSRFEQEFPALSPGSMDKRMPTAGVVESKPMSTGPLARGTVKDFAHTRGARWSFTVEAPGSVSYLDQVMGENQLVHQLVLEARLAQHRDAAQS